MSYVKRTFVDGETPLNKELFDHLQEGIAGALQSGDAEEMLGLTHTDSPLPFADIKCGNPVDASMWLCDHVYQKGYVKHIKTRLMQGNGVTVNAGIVKASDLTLLRKYSVTANVGEVIIPVDEYIDCDFYVALAGTGLDFVGGKYSVYPFKYISGAATTYLTSLNEGDVIGRTFGEFTDSKTTYVLAQEVEYNGRYNTSSPYTYTRNKMFAAGDSITAGYYSVNGTGYAVDTWNKWWSIVGRTLGYKAAKVASTGSGFAFLKNGTNACTLIEDVNFKSYDVAVFAFGTNDYGENTPIGTIDDAYTSATDANLTFYAAVKHVVEKVLTSNPTCELIFVLPINRCDKGSLESNWAFNAANSAGHTLSEYCDAIIAVCDKYGIPYIDRRNSIFNAYSLQTLMSDRVHPNEEGYKLLGMELSARIGALIRPYAEYNGGA